MTDLQVPYGVAKSVRVRRWWRSGTMRHGGRDADIIAHSDGTAKVYDSRGRYAGVTEVPDPPDGHGAEVDTDVRVWLVSDLLRTTEDPTVAPLDPWGLAEAIRPSGAVLIETVTGWHGILDAESGHDGEWRAAYAHLLLGCTPPVDVFGRVPTAEYWAVGTQLFGDRIARRVKRAALRTVAEERRALDESRQELAHRAAQMRATWR